MIEINIISALSDNYIYLLRNIEKNITAVVDPGESKPVEQFLNDKGWHLDEIVNTHHHHDHTGGNGQLKEIYGSKLIAPIYEKEKISNLDVFVSDNDVISIAGLETKVIHTPGHTLGHVCFYIPRENILFSGDTLFNAGAGNCHNGGHPEQLYETFFKQFKNLSNNTLIYPGHDYLENNLKFTLDREPTNIQAQELLNSIKNNFKPGSIITNLEIENNINTFFRLSNTIIIDKLREEFPELPSKPSQKEVFLLLRQLRNKW